MTRLTLWALSGIFAVYMPTCATPTIRPTLPSSEARVSELWEAPTDLPTRDVFYGPWGTEHAPDAAAAYTFVKPKQHGTNPGMTVRDPQGREWHVKQAPHNHQGAEGPVEVALSRVLSAVGYHQPPVYLLPSFKLVDETGEHVVPGGRFRLRDRALKDLGTWSWQQNPFVNTDPYQGLLVILMMFDSSDLKNDNNSLYAVADPRDGPDRWYVVRDLGTALGETGKLTPRRSDPDLFDRQVFISGVKNGFVEFSYHGWHKELFDRRIAPRHVRWASDLLARMSDRQWEDAFRAGGYEPDVAARFIRRLRQKIRDGQQLTD
ncbi:MAG TPA: hypothetical protein VGY48_19415 [Vicinamibacterales bacterium]|jgi:hypothetical protein|nr:hypothetical protein [Vicinamibacterales bacterium]